MKWMFEHCEAAPTPLNGGTIAHSLIRPAQRGDAFFISRKVGSPGV